MCGRVQATELRPGFEVLKPVSGRLFRDFVSKPRLCFRSHVDFGVSGADLVSQFDIMVCLNDSKAELRGAVLAFLVLDDLFQPESLVDFNGIGIFWGNQAESLFL